tara:strand:+ start:2067 stop:2462 length:396 start_codon:yes stop_codon:yes gene_type:complete
MPSKLAMDVIRRDKIESREIEMWGEVENRQNMIEPIGGKLKIDKINDDGSVNLLDKDQTAIAWSKLGIEKPLQPVEKTVSALDVSEESKSFEEPEKESYADAPDWELIKKMSELSSPIQGVPGAPDLGSLE